MTSRLDVADIDRLPAVLDAATGPRLVIAAGGDGTVGSVAGYVAGTEHDGQADTGAL